MSVCFIRCLYKKNVKTTEPNFCGKTYVFGWSKLNNFPRKKCRHLLLFIIYLLYFKLISKPRSRGLLTQKSRYYCCNAILARQVCSFSSKPWLYSVFILQTLSFLRFMQHRLLQFRPNTHNFTSCVILHRLCTYVRLDTDYSEFNSIHVQV